MPVVKMPDGTLVNMPDQIPPELGTRLRALQQDQATKAATAANPDVSATGAQVPEVTPPVPRSHWGERLVNTGKDVAGAAYGALGDAADVGVRLSHAISGDGDAPLPGGPGSQGEANRAVFAHPDTAPLAPVQTKQGPVDVNHLGGGSILTSPMEALSRATNALPQPAADTVKENAPAAVELGGAVLGVPSLVRGAAGVAETAARVPGAVRAGAQAVRDARAATPGVTALSPQPPGQVLHPLQRAQQSGFQIAPNDVPSASSTPLNQVPGSTIQKVTESPAVEADRQHGNTTLATKTASKDIGLPESDIILPEHIEAAKQAPSATYTRTGELIPQVVNPADETKAALQAIIDEDRPQFQASTKVRADAQRQLAALESGQTTGPQMMRDIQFLRDEGSPTSLKAARALEDEMANQLQAQNPKGLADYQAARQQFAKIYDVQASLRNGRVDPQALAARAAEEGHPGMTGGLEDIRNAATAAPNSVRMPGTVKDQISANRSGLIKNAGKAIARAVTPDLTTPERQLEIAGSAGGPVQLPVTGPHQSGAVLPEQPRLPMGPGGPRDVMEAPPGQVTPGATVRPPAPAFELAPGAGNYTPPLERGPDGVLRPAERLPQDRGNGPVIEPLQREAAVPQATGPLNVGDQVARQMRMARESGVRSAPRAADIRGNGPAPLPKTATPGQGVSAPGSLHGYGEPASEGMRPALLRQFIEAILRHGR